MHPGGGAIGPVRVGMGSRCYKIAPDGPHAAGLVDNGPGHAGRSKKFGVVVSGLDRAGVCQ